MHTDRRGVVGPHLRSRAGTLALLGLLQLTSVTATLALPGLNAALVDEGVARGDLGAIWRSGGLMAAVGVGQLLVAAAAVAVGARLSARVARDLRARVFAHTMRLGTAELRRFGPGSLVTRCGNDVVQVQALLLTLCTVVVTVPLTAVGAVVLGLRLDPQLAWLMAVAAPVLLAVVVAFALLALPGYRRLQVQMDHVNTVLREQLTGVRVTRVLRRETHERARFDAAHDPLVATSRQVGALYLAVGPVTSLLMSLGAVAVVWWGGQRVADGELGIGAVTAFIAYLLQLLTAVLMASSVVMLLPRGRVSAVRLRELLATTPEVVDPIRPDTRPAPAPGAGLQLVGVGLHRPGAREPVLDGVDVRLHPGGRVLVVGATGSGKSTLLRLAARHLVPSAGRVRLDGTDLADLPVAEVRRRVALVPQRAHLFSGTVRSTLLTGAPAGRVVTDAELWAALRAACADSVVAALPRGLDEPVGAGGRTLSGGQRQRLALARALLGRAEHYLLDDVTSALDGRTADLLRDSLDEHLGGAGLVTVTSRPDTATAAAADLVLVVDRGRVVDSGAHHDLLARCDAYAELLAAGADQERVA